MKKFSVSIDGHKTSYSLEPEFYLELQRFAHIRNHSVSRLIREIDHSRPTEQNLSSAIRIFLLKEIKAEAARNIQAG